MRIPRLKAHMRGPWVSTLDGGLPKDSCVVPVGIAFGFSLGDNNDI